MIEIGQYCINCGNDQTNQLYKSPICYCIWTELSTCECPEIKRAGYKNNLIIEDFTEDIFENHLNFEQIYCYETLSHRNTCVIKIERKYEFVCETCFTEIEGHEIGGKIWSTKKYHITSLDLLKTECHFCEEIVLFANWPHFCYHCRINSYTKSQIIRQKRKLRTVMSK